MLLPAVHTRAYVCVRVLDVLHGSLYPLLLALRFSLMAGHLRRLSVLLALQVHHVTMPPQTGSSSQIAHQDYWHSGSCFLSSETQLLAPSSHLFPYVLWNFIAAVTYIVAPLSWPGSAPPLPRI